ncbi:MAG: hypothetical protein LBC61_00300 [Candidatus Peribacteria bacterium]|nr:hypothetical protein [Candidatus Peribacteria bacterium]
MIEFSNSPGLNTNSGANLFKNSCSMVLLHQYIVVTCSTCSQSQNKFSPFWFLTFSKNSSKVEVVIKTSCLQVDFKIAFRNTFIS